MASPALLQHAETPTGAWWVNGATSGIIAFAGNTAAGSLMVLFVKTMSNISLSSVTDTQGNTWTLGTKISASGGTSVQAAWALSTVGGSTPTVTANFASAVAQAVGSLAEFSNIQNVRNVAFFSTIESVIGTGLSAVSSIQANVTGDLVLSICDSGTANTHLQIAGPTDTSQSMPWSAVPVQAFVDADSFAWAWGIGVQAAGKTTNTWTLTNSANWSASIFSFAPPVPAQISPTTTSDNCTRANEAPLSDAGKWSTWGSAAALNLTSNAVVPSSTTLICGSYWNANVFGSDHYSEVVVASVGAANAFCGPSVRMSSNGSQTNGYWAGVSGATNMLIQKVVNGVRTTLGTAVAVTATAPGDVIRLSITGCLLTLTRNGVVIKSINDTTFPTGGAPGIMIFQNSQASPTTFSSWNGGQFGDSRYYQSTTFGEDGTATSYNGAFTAPNKAGSLLVACVGFPDLSDPTTAISDSQNNVWNKIAGVINGPTFGQTFFYCLNAKAGANTITATRTGGGHLPVTAAEYTSPLGLGWTLDTSTKNSGNASATITATLATANANEILVAYVGVQLNGALGVIPTASFRLAWTGEIKLFDQPAANAGSNTFTLTPVDTNGTPTTLNQEILLVAFALAGASTAGAFIAGAVPTTAVNASGHALAITSPTLGGKLGQPTPIVFTDPNGNEYSVTGATVGAEIAGALPVVLCNPNGQPIVPPIVIHSGANSVTISSTLTGTKLGRPIPIVLTDGNGASIGLSGFSTTSFVANPTPCSLTDLNGNTVTLTVATS